MSQIEHPVLSTTFLPLQRKSLARFVAQGTPPQTALEQAGLMAAQLCRTRPHAPAEIERLLHDACALFAGNEGAGAQLAGPGVGSQPELDAWLDALAARGVLLAPTEILQDFIAQSPQAYPGLALQQACQQTLAEHEIRFPAVSISEEQEADDEDPSPSDGAQDHRGLYTSEQAVVLRAILANPDELISLDAYAGTGKSHLVLALMGARPRRYTYVAPTLGQVEAFQARMPSSTGSRLLTQIQFINRLAQNAARAGRTNGFVATYRKSTLSPEIIAARIGLQPIGSRTPREVLMTAFEAINRWCASAEPSMTFKHFDRSVPGAMHNVEPYLLAAEHVWRCMFDARTQRGGCLSLTPAHIAKWLALKGVTPPLDMGTLLIDEAHDLSPSWTQMLAAHLPGVVNLGDPHQCLTGTPHRWQASKKLEMHQSVRQGSQVDGLVNQALSLDYLGQDNGPFKGARDRATGVLRYRHWSQIPANGVRIYGNPIRLVQDAIDLHAVGARLHILPATLRTLKNELWKGLNAWRRVLAGGSLRDWEAFVEGLQRDGQAELADLFSGRDAPQRISQMQESLVPAEECQVMLLLAEHAKNVQFDAVSLADCCFSVGQSKVLRHDLVRAVYLAMTRASHQLWIPEHAIEQLQLGFERQSELKARQKEERRHASGYRPWHHS